MRVTGITIGGFRSICGNPVTLSPLRRANMLIGPNCQGKSNILRALRYADPYHTKPPEGPDVPSGTGPSRFSLELTLKGPDPTTTEAMRDLGVDRLVRVFGVDTGRVGNAWKLVHANDDAPDLRSLALYAKANNLSKANHEGSVRAQEAKGHLVTAVQSAAQWPQSVVFIGSPPHASTEYGHQKTLVSSYATGTNPLPQVPEHKEAERRIVALSALLHELGIQVGRAYVPAGTDQVYAERHGRILPMDSHGTGLEHSLSLANWVLDVASDKTWVLIEEPETHLHPGLVYPLLRFLLKETKSTYFIATHSPSLLVLDDDVSLFRVSMDTQGATHAEHVASGKGASAVLTDLGARPSDVLLPNFIVWVEGPSDRILIRRWLELAEPELRENTHFSFMMYGGSTLEEYSFADADDTELEDAVSAPSFGRKAAVVMDSDKGNPQVKQNRIERVKHECEGAGLTFWLTDGRTIEHYLPATKVLAHFDAKLRTQHVVEEIPALKPDQDLDDWLWVIYGPPTKGKKYYSSKTFHCRAIAETLDAACLEQPGLKEKITELAEAIREANRLPRRAQ